MCVNAAITMLAPVPEMRSSCATSDIAGFIAQPIVGQTLQIPRRFHLLGRDDALEEINRREFAGNDAKYFLPAQAKGARFGEFHQTFFLTPSPWMGEGRGEGEVGDTLSVPEKTSNGA